MFRMFNDILSAFGTPAATFMWIALVLSVILIFLVPALLLYVRTNKGLWVILTLSFLPSIVAIGGYVKTVLKIKSILPLIPVEQRTTLYTQGVEAANVLLWPMIVTIYLICISMVYCAIVSHIGGKMRLKVRNVLLGAAGYTFGFVYLIRTEPVIAAIAAIYTLACMIIARQLIVKAELRKYKSTNEFSKSNAFSAFGSEWVSFHHVFHSNEPVIEAYRQTLSNSLKAKLACQELQEIVFKDVDKDQRPPESRSFILTTAKETSRKTGVALLCDFTRNSDIQGIRWWIFVSGVRDPNKVFWRYAFAPISTPFIIVPYFRRMYNPLPGLTTIDPGFFNGIDILNRTRELQFVAFEALVEVLNTFGIDTSDLKQQKGNILNINVSGGRTSFGSIVQGAMNRVSGMVGNVKMPAGAKV